MELILGSGSPRRGEILRFFAIPFLQIASNFDEESVAFTGDPLSYVSTLAQEKAKALALEHPSRTMVTADTIVLCEGVLYNKPKDKEQAISFLTHLGGRWHSVFTAVALFHQEELSCQVEETNILFHELSDQQIEQYLRHVNFLDKAGSYAIQQSGGLIVKRIEGCYYNVMGLPLSSLRQLLLRTGIDLWDRLKIL